MKQFLSDIEKSKIKAFTEDKVMFEAVKKVLLFGITDNGVFKQDVNSDPTRNWALSMAFKPGYTDEQLGQDLRGMAQGISFLEKAFGQFIDMSEEGIKSPIQKDNIAE